MIATSEALQNTVSRLEKYALIASSKALVE